ncbi:MAG TPA: TetR/AcrR family transcriptional regulator [Pseudonocardiaceae bacterium]
MPSGEPEQLIWQWPEPPGRKHALTRADVVRAAIAIADADGVPGLTMRAVADALGGVTPMSLYRYVLNKDGLVDLMLDEVSTEVAVPDEPGEDWLADLRGVAASLWQMIGRHRWYAELVDSRPPFGPLTLRRSGFLLSVFGKAGLTPPVVFVSLLENYVTGAAMSVSREIEMLTRFNIRSVQDLQPYLDNAAVDFGEMPEFTGDDRFELGLDCLLAGMAAKRATRA